MRSTIRRRAAVTLASVLASAIAVGTLAIGQPAGAQDAAVQAAETQSAGNQPAEPKDSDVSSESAEAKSEEAAPSGAAKNVVQKLAKAGNFTTLIAAVQAAGLADTLANTQNITVFAPTDAAFAKIPAAQLQAIIADKAKLTDILTYHVSPRPLREAGLARRGKAPTLFGADIAVTGTPEDLVLNGNVNITLGDIRANNGVIHAIDTVLTPPAKPKDVVDTAIAAGQFTTLVAAIQAAGLESTLRTTDNITVFAPTDAAFAKIGKSQLDAIIADKALLTKILTYHVAGRVVTAEQIISAQRGTIRTLQGEKVSFAVQDGKVILNGNVMVTATDIRAKNGIVHVIDTVLLPPSLTAPPKPTKDVVDTAIGAGQFTTLVAAVQAAGLESTLRNASNITVFAPTDAAFAKLGTDTINALLADKAALSNILRYHVGFPQVTSEQFIRRGNGSIFTLNGQAVRYQVKDGKLFLNDTVLVVTADVRATNGIIHVIDTVLTPPVRHGG
jgi:transforming growth factor-beta-induced protein